MGACRRLSPVATPGIERATERPARNLESGFGLNPAARGRLYLLFRPDAHYGWLVCVLSPTNVAVEWFGVLLTAAGVGDAIWARMFLPRFS